MKATGQQLLPIQFIATTAIPVAIKPGQIRRNGITPLLIKSLPAQMAARAARAANPA